MEHAIGRVPLNGGWWYRPGPVEEAFLAESWLGPSEAGGWRPVHLPHDMSEVPLNGFEEHLLARKGCYARDIPLNSGTGEYSSTRDDAGSLPSSALVTFLEFDGVAVSCSVWVNGQLATSHRGPYTPFSVQIPHRAPASGRGQPSDNSKARILVEVDTAEDPQVPPFGGVVDYLVLGGIYRGVWLRRCGPVWIEDAWSVPKLAHIEENADSPLMSTRGAEWEVPVQVALSSIEGSTPDWSMFFLRARLTSEQGTHQECEAGASPCAMLTLRITDPCLWDIENPHLYRLTVTLEDRGGRVLDLVEKNIGFRTARFTPRGFFLNGRRVFLRGLNRHQEFPWVGYAMSPDGQRRDAELLKRELGLSMVRTSHYPQSPYFLDACDALGLLVFEELPGWQHVGDHAWQDQSLRDLEAMIRRDRSHPSVVLWGVRVNESQDNHEFYARTSALARQLDPSRQTGGVRYIRKSELLEDVYTFNDFSFDGDVGPLAAEPGKVRKKGSPLLADPASVLPADRSAPYLITEHSGHMFPAKRFDQEERLVAHALRHARILDAAMGDQRIAGCIGWCAFDYHTHKDFGSGDRVCYHGVMDMFRIPKYAAWVYASQVEPEERVVLEPATRFAKGERDAARVLPIYVFTNCDAVDLYRGGRYVDRFFPDRKHFRNLKHPPVIIDDMIGHLIDAERWPEGDAVLFRRLAGTALAQGASRLNLLEKIQMGLFMLRRGLSMRDIELLVMRYGMGWGAKDESVRLVGLLNGREVIERTFGADSVAQTLVLEPDAAELDVCGDDEWSAARVVVRAVDQYANTVPFLFEPFHVDIEGPARLLGPQWMSLQSGAAAFWVCAGNDEGTVRIKVDSPRFRDQVQVDIRVVRRSYTRHGSRDWDLCFPRSTAARGTSPSA